MHIVYEGGSSIIMDYRQKMSVDADTEITKAIKNISRH